jgi:hypothetical protein
MKTNQQQNKNNQKTNPKNLFSAAEGRGIMRRKGTFYFPLCLD